MSPEEEEEEEMLTESEWSTEEKQEVKLNFNTKLSDPYAHLDLDLASGCIETHVMY